MILGTQCQEAKGKMKQKLPSDQTNKQTDPEGDTYLQLELQTCRPRRPLDAGRPCPCLSTQPAPFLIHQLASPSPWVGHFPGFWKVLPINPFPARLLGLKISGLSPLGPLSQTLLWTLLCLPSHPLEAGHLTNCWARVWEEGKHPPPVPPSGPNC